MILPGAAVPSGIEPLWHGTAVDKLPNSALKPALQS